MSTLNTITVINDSRLLPTQYTVWVAGYIEQSGSYLTLQSDGTFTSSTTALATFINVNKGLTIDVPNVTNYGNNRLVFTVTKISSPTPNPLSPITGYTAYPFPGIPGVCPPGPYDIFEFGPNAQYDVSAVDSFGLNLSFTVKGDPLTYGPVISATRWLIGQAFNTFMSNDPLGKNGFAQLLYTSPTGTGYPDQILDQFSAIVAPKDWLAIYPGAAGLSGYWKDTISAFFTTGNQLNIALNAATVGNYSGSCDGTKYTLSGPNNLSIVIPASDFTAPNQGFIQAVRGQNPGESAEAYAAFGQIEAAIFEAMSRGVLLDGVVPGGTTIGQNYSSDAWININNWYTNHNNAYNSQPSVYDAYAKFMHHGTIPMGTSNMSIFGLNSAGSFGMAYGFSLDENPNVGSVGSWSNSNNVPSKPIDNIGSGQDVTLIIGPWAAAVFKD